MKRKKKQDIKVVEKERTEDLTDAVIEKVLKELREEETVDAEIEEQVQKHKKSRRFRRLVLAAIVLVVGVALFLLINLQTYTTARVSVTYEINSTGNNSYREYANGVLKYSRDGIAYINRKGDEEWNHPYQIKTPMVQTYFDDAIVVADKGGNTIIVLDQKGLKGEMQTTLPIEKVCVSKQGIVCAILKNDSTPKIVCYDAAGNSLVELNTSLTGTGYPLDVSLSEDGTLLLVSYLSVQNGQLMTKARYYNFSEKKENSQEYEVTSDEYANMAAAKAFFINDNTSVIVGDDRLLIYKGDQKPELSVTVELDKEIKSVFNSDRYVGLVLKNEGTAGYELCLYNMQGKKVMSQGFTGDYSNVKICGGQVILYDGKKCSVYTRSGIHKFGGELETNILEIFPVLGVNKYIVMSANGMEVVRFVK